MDILKCKMNVMEVIIPDNYVLHKHNDENAVLEYDGRVYKVGRDILLLLDLINMGYNTIDRLYNRIKENDPNASKEQISRIIEVGVLPLFEESSAKKKRSVRKIKELIKPETLNRMDFGELAGLFTPKVFWPLLSLAIVINVYFLSSVSVPSLGSLGWLSKTLAGAMIFLLILIHEIGHVAATRNYNSSSGEIGFGFYFILPVLYTDLTSIWALDKHKRVRINLSGIYFQAISGCILIVLAGILNWPGAFNIITKVISLNFSIMIINSFPLLKFDGYWVYSDLFDISNLRKKSLELIKNIFLFRNVKRGNFWIWLYSIAYLVFIAFLIHRILKLFTSSIYTVAAQSLSSDFSIWEVDMNYIARLAICIVVAGVVLFRLFLLLRYLYKRLLVLSVGAILLVNLSSCSVTTDCVTGNNNRVVRSFDVISFNKLNKRGNINVVYSQGNVPSVMLESDANLSDYFEAYVIDDVLFIEDRNEDCFTTHGGFTMKVTSRNIDNIDWMGSGDLVFSSIEPNSTFAINKNGSGDIIFESATQVDNLYIKKSGSGDVRAFNVESRKSEIVINGSGDAEVNVAEDLVVSINGSGNVFYLGDPNISIVEIIGSGKVIKRD